MNKFSVRKLKAPLNLRIRAKLAVPKLEPHKIYIERLIFMAALAVLSVWVQGLRAAVVCVLSVALCMLSDAVCCRIRKIPYEIRSPEVPFWGLAAAMMMPASVPYWLVALSAVICIVVGKHLFGGSDNIVFCPPAISTAFLLICYPAQMLYFPKYGVKPPVFGVMEDLPSRSAEYSLKLGIAPTADVSDILMGLVPAAIGTAYILIIAVCGLCMIIRRSNSVCAVLSCLVVSGVLAFLFPRADVSGWYSVFYELTSGYLLFGVVFLASEPYRMPSRPVGCVLYGVVLGYITMMFRIFGQTEGSFLFALLITGAVTDAFDRVVENLSYWKRTYLNSFEKNKVQAETKKNTTKSITVNNSAAGVPKLTDTQEIVLPEKYRYNMPPINSEIKRKRRVGTADRENEDNKR